MRLTSSSVPSPVSLTLGHEHQPNGNLSRITENSVATDFEYDELDRLLKRKITGGADQETFTYAAIGNIATKNGLSFSYSSSHKHAVSNYNNVAYDYDANGNMIQHGSAQFLKFDAENRLVKMTSDSNGYVYIARMAYDGDGKRAKRVDNYGTMHYAGPHYERNVGTGADTTEVVTKFYYAQMGCIKRLIAFKKGSALFYVVPDHLGGTLTVVDTSGNNVDDIRYHAFGATRSGGTNTPTDKRFTGQTLDQSTGLYDFGARSYDCGIGRFCQPDSIVPDFKNPQSLNRYSYTINNPLKYTDPTGHSYVPAPLTVSPVQASPPPTGPTGGPAPVPAPTAGPSPAPGTAASSAGTPQAAPTAVPAPTPVQGPAPTQSSGAQKAAGPAPMPFAAPLENSWNSVNNLIGMTFGALGGEASSRVDDGSVIVYENMSGVAGAFMNIVGGDVITIGNVILAKEQLPYGSDTYRHERGHVMQGAILGPFYLPTYLANGYEAIRKSGSFDATKHWHYNDMEKWTNELAGLPRDWSP